MSLLSIGRSLPSELQNPFSKSCIKDITLYYNRVTFETYFSWRGSITFVKGNTEGTQKFEVSDKESKHSFEDITNKMRDFIETL